MSHGHSHTHAHRDRLALVLGITLTVLVVEVVGGLLSGSLALLADAGHMLTDATGLVLALIGATLGARAASARRTYGLQRAEVLAALSNALLLVGVAVWVLIQAVERLQRPGEVETTLMLVVVALIAPRAWMLLREVVDVLLEATPEGVDLDRVRQHICDVPGVVDVHDLHVWAITSGVPVLSAHVVVDDECLRDGRSGVVLDRLGECLGGHFDVEHCTFQLEPLGHAEHEPAQHA